MVVTLPSGSSYRCWVREINEKVINGEGTGSFIGTTLQLRVVDREARPSLRKTITAVQNLTNSLRKPLSRALANGMSKAAVLEAVGQLVDSIAPDLQEVE